MDRDNAFPPSILQKHCQSRQQNDKPEVERREQPYVVAALAGVVLQVFAEGDQAGKRSDQRACAADVDPEQQLAIVPRELRSQNRRRYVTAHLARKHADQQSVLFQKLGKEAPHPFDAPHIPCKYEEKDKGEQKRLVDFFQRLSVEQEYAERDHDQADLIGDHPEYDDDRQRKQEQIDRRL